MLIAQFCVAVSQYQVLSDFWKILEEASSSAFVKLRQNQIRLNARNFKLWSHEEKKSCEVVSFDLNNKIGKLSNYVKTFQYLSGKIWSKLNFVFHIGDLSRSKLLKKLVD